MKTTTIKILPIEELRIIKQITLISQFANNQDYSIGYILYERKLTKEYKFVETPEEEKDFKYYMEYPRQDSYPNDNIDELILQSIRNSFPKSTLRNHSIICNVDIDKKERMQNREFRINNIQFTPNFSQIDMNDLKGKSFEGLNISIKVYNDYKLEGIENLFFQGYYNLNDLNVLDELDTIQFI